jgi:hypothetical protein
MVNGGPTGSYSKQRETGGVVNWYFDGHSNKLTFDVFRLNVQDDDGTGSRWRARVQWDISF